jgi:hypothetical protein
MRCPSCAGELSPSHGFCPSCAALPCGSCILCPPESAHGSRRPPRSHPPGILYLWLIDDFVGIWRAPCSDRWRIKTVHLVRRPDAFLGRGALAVVHCLGAVCAPPMARITRIVEPRACGQLPGPSGGAGPSCGSHVGSPFFAIEGSGTPLGLMDRCLPGADPAIRMHFSGSIRGASP